FQETYAQRIWRHFAADSFARNGLRVIIALFVIAALAPFLANNHAIIRVADGRIPFPVFPSLEPIEWRFLLYVPLAAVAYRFRARFVTRPLLSFFAAIILIALVEIALNLTHPVNDPT